MLRSFPRLAVALVLLGTGCASHGGGLDVRPLLADPKAAACAIVHSTGCLSRAGTASGDQVDFATALPEYADAERRSIICGRTSKGERWRLRVFNAGGYRTLVYAERAVRGADGAWMPVAYTGLPGLNDAGLSHYAMNIQCEVLGPAPDLSRGIAADAIGGLHGDDLGEERAFFQTAAPDSLLVSSDLYDPPYGFLTSALYAKVPETGPAQELAFDYDISID